MTSQLSGRRRKNPGGCSLCAMDRIDHSTTLCARTAVDAAVIGFPSPRTSVGSLPRHHLSVRRNLNSATRGGAAPLPHGWPAHMERTPCVRYKGDDMKLALVFLVGALLLAAV